MTTVTAAPAPARMTPNGPICGDHKLPLQGDPVQYYCPDGHRVMAADIDREVTT